MENSSTLSTSSSTSTSSSLSLSSNNDHHNLDNMPDDIYIFYLFKYLDLDDILEMRLISKRFYCIVRDYHTFITELSFLSSSTCCINYGYKDNWFSTTKSTKLAAIIDSSSRSLLTNPLNNLINLKRLKIIDYNSPSIKTKHLNKFTKLEILELEHIIPTPDCPLQLPNLKALFIQPRYQNLVNDSLILDTPNLQSLAILCVDVDLNLIDNGLKFNYPLSVKNLQISCYDKGMCIFANLECLEICLSFFELDVLSKFKKLKKLKCNHNCSAFDKLKEIFKSKKDGLELVLHGVRIKESDKIDEFYRKESILEYQLDNYDELESDLSFFWRIFYNDFESLMRSDRPADLFAKYTNIQLIEICSTIEDENRLVHFVRECSNLNQLNVSRSSLSQQFYDRLPDISSLSHLIIIDEDINLNFEFLMKMPYLRCLYTDQDVVISDKLNLNDLKYLEWFQIEINNQKFDVKKEGKDRYLVCECERLAQNTVINFKKMIRWSNWLRNKSDRETRSSKKRKLSE